MPNSSEPAASGGFPGRRPELELLAPAGDWPALEAALEAGADAVYLGLRTLNARRQARNFTQQEFARAVDLAHARGARLYLTLNTDLAERELGLAARMLWWARECGADAVLVRDPALLALKPEFAGLDFHFSTQSCMANTADVEAAATLGIRRAVLAREMTLGEIRAASAVAGVETEVFVQGALCFSVSGRCYLSSWGGGRSGNRGLCTSPCRVPWAAPGRAADTPFSMRDLAAIQRLGELREAGVAALKIEGRMKTAAWVARAVELYRQALGGEASPALLEQARQLGAYTGRQITSGYLDGDRKNLTAPAGRQAVQEEVEQESDLARGRGAERAGLEEAPQAGQPFPYSPAGEPAECEISASEQADAEAGEVEADEPEAGDAQAGHVQGGESAATFDLTIDIQPRAIACQCTCGQRSEQWSLPKTVVHRAHKAILLGDLLAWLGEQTISGHRPNRLATNDPAFLLVPRAVNKLVERIGAVVRRAERRGYELTGIDLPASIRHMLEKAEPHPANRFPLGNPPDRVRLDASQVRDFVRQVRPREMIVEGLTPENLTKVRRSARKVPIVAALPPVFFEDDIPALEKLVRQCKGAGVPVEVNSWGGWMLARRAEVRMEGGPGWPVLNSLAARKLVDLGLRCVTLSVEADRRQLEDLTACCPAPCSLVVFGRPPLLTTRAELDDERFRDHVLVDRRQIRIRGDQERGLWVFRPVAPYDLRDVRNERIRVAHLVVDLVGSTDPAAEFASPPGEGSPPFRFNYDRTLT